MNDHSEIMATSIKVDKKELIRQAALSVFARHGFYSTTAQQIAAEADVAVGTLYNHFKDKEDILIHILDTEMNERQAAVLQIVGKDLPMREQIKQIIAFHMERAVENKFMMRLFLGEELHLSGKLEKFTYKLFKEIPDRMVLMLQAAMDRGELRRADPLVLAHAIMGANRSVMVRASLYDDDAAKRIRDHAAEELTEFIWQGIKPT